MLKFFSASVLLIFISFQGFSQKTELGISFGGSLFSGDVNPDYALKETRPSLSLLYRRYLTDKFTLRSNLLFTTLRGNDYEDMSFSVKEVSYKARNLSFRSRIAEVSMVSEFFLKNLLKKKSSPYVLAGIGCFYFNPQAEYQDQWYHLQPLGTEGQGLPGFPQKYNRIQVAAIVGLGYKQRLSPQVSLAFEIGFRFTTTDYIDDVSKTYADKEALKSNGPMSPILSDRSGEIPYLQAPPGYGNAGYPRGNPDNKDKYLIYNLTLSYRFFFIGTPAYIED